MLFANESASPLKESLACTLVSFYFRLRQVSLAEYILVLRGFVLIIIADDQMYYGYYINCQYPVMGDN
jgi:hypothetical protein